MPANEGLLVLQNEAARVVLDPRAGGAVREFSWRGAHVLRPAPAAGSDPFALACFPMVPYVNRIAGGRFRFAGRNVRLERNWSEDPHPLHGQGWRAPWTVEEAARSSATLRFAGGGDEWPWRYRSEQRVRLDVDALSIELSLENLSEAAMPAMVGLHPYFPGASHARLRARLPRVWLADAGGLPIEEAPTPAAWCFDPPRKIQAVPLDHCFAGWDGAALIEWPQHTVHLRARRCAFLQAYVPADRDFFCIEPQSAPSGAIGRDAGEASVLAPGERMNVEVHIRVAAR